MMIMIRVVIVEMGEEKLSQTFFANVPTHRMQKFHRAKKGLQISICLAARLARSRKPKDAGKGRSIMALVSIVNITLQTLGEMIMTLFI